jgi:hypothetical protein
VRESGPRRNAWRAGGALVLVYAAAAVFTLRVGPLRVRPLYDSGPSAAPAYRWVNPPKELAKGNVKPKPETKPLAWSSEGNAGDAPSTSDGQAIVSFAAKTIVPAPGVEGADVSFTPVDAETLGPLPEHDLRPDGNAYKIEVTYSPSAAKVTSFAKTPIAVLRWATNGLGLYYSPDGKSWQNLDKGVQITPAPSAIVSADWAGAGYYLPVSKGTLSFAPPPKGFPTATIISGVLVLIPIAGIVWFVFPRKHDDASKAKAKAKNQKKKAKKR